MALQEAQARIIIAPAQPIAEPVIRVAHLSVTYSQMHAVEDISFSVQPGDKVAIIGPNGAGKSTLMKSIMGLLQPNQGSRIDILGDPQRLGYVPQHNDVNWDFPVTVRDVVMMGLTRRIGWLRWPGRSHQLQVDEALERVGMTAFAKRQIGELSGGQQRRVFVARALAQQADVLLLDEPFAGVDVAAQQGLMEVIDVLNLSGITILLSTHDLALAFQRFPIVMALNQRLIAYGAAADVYQPQILQQLYGGKVMAWTEDGDLTMVIDEHGCC